MFKANGKEIANLRDKIYRRLMQELQKSTSWLSEIAENGNREHGWEIFFKRNNRTFLQTERGKSSHLISLLSTEQDE